MKEKEGLGDWAMEEEEAVLWAEQSDEWCPRKHVCMYVYVLAPGVCKHDLTCKNDLCRHLQ